MSAWDDLKRASEAAKALTAQYEALSTQKDEIDGLNDIQGYAVDWPDEIEAVVDDLNQWLEDEGHKRNASAVSAKAGAHFLYR